MRCCPKANDKCEKKKKNNNNNKKKKKKKKNKKKINKKRKISGKRKKKINTYFFYGPINIDNCRLCFFCRIDRLLQPPREEGELDGIDDGQKEEEKRR